MKLFADSVISHGTVWEMPALELGGAGTFVIAGPLPGGGQDCGRPSPLALGVGPGCRLDLSGPLVFCVWGFLLQSGSRRACPSVSLAPLGILSGPRGGGRSGGRRGTFMGGSRATELCVGGNYSEILRGFQKILEGYLFRQRLQSSAW